MGSGLCMYLNLFTKRMLHKSFSLSHPRRFAATKSVARMLLA
jgi:hypothetical protein